MKKASELDIKGTIVRVVKVNDEDYICLTDMLKAKDGEFFIADWLRNRNTLEFIGIWERVYNPAFNYGEFATIRNQAGLNSFKVGVQEFAARTNAMSLISRAGRYGGTYAHKDIAFEFADLAFYKHHQATHLCHVCIYRGHVRKRREPFAAISSARINGIVR